MSSTLSDEFGNSIELGHRSCREQVIVKHEVSHGRQRDSLGFNQSVMGDFVKAITEIVELLEKKWIKIVQNLNDNIWFESRDGSLCSFQNGFLMAFGVQFEKNGAGDAKLPNIRIERDGLNRQGKV